MEALTIIGLTLLLGASVALNIHFLNRLIRCEGHSREQKREIDDLRELAADSIALNEHLDVIATESQKTTRQLLNYEEVRAHEETHLPAQ